MGWGVCAPYLYDLYIAIHITSEIGNAMPPSRVYLCLQPTKEETGLSYLVVTG